MVLPDVNVLVYAHREDAVHHAACRAWVEGVINGNESYGLSELVLSGFVRVVTHPKVFTRLAVLSPSVWWDQRAVLRTVRSTCAKPPLKIWVDMGTAEGRRGLDDARLLKAALVGAGFVEGRDLRYAEYEGATHSEGAWASRVATRTAHGMCGDVDSPADIPPNGATRQ